MKDKLCSILVPVYNRELYIRDTLRSAMEQTYENIEIIVVDNNSTDNTWNILKEMASTDKRIKIYRNEENIGPVKNWKRCIDLASGEYGKILWSDDLISPDFLEKTIPFLQDKEVGFVFTTTEIFGDDTEKGMITYNIGDTGVYEIERYIHGILIDGNFPVSPGCALFRLEDLKKSLIVDVPNKVNSDFAMHAIGNDLLIFLLTAIRYKYFAFINEKLSFFRAHKESISISSRASKIALHYLLAKSYFVENFRKDLIKKNNTMIYLNSLRFREDARRYNLDRIENYYLFNKDYRIDYLFLTQKVLRWFVNKMKIKLLRF
ncbi:MAG: glycosyltransferase [Hydrogenothermaceae bacterium]|nr:glycosyltransferase [Hydrogenothermaceae bacterium]